jgi:hypothetical protein
VLLEKRADGRMARITVDDVLERVAVWRERYADAALAHVAAVRTGGVPSAPSHVERPDPALRDA